MLRKKRIIDNGTYATRNKGSKRVPHVLLLEGEEYKYCSKCHSLKTLDDFNDNKNTWDNKTSFCKECTAEIMKYNYNKKKWKKVHPDEEFIEIKKEESERYDLTTIELAVFEQLDTRDYQFVDYV